MMASVVNFSLGRAYKAGISKTFDFHRLDGINASEVIIAKGNIIEGIEAKE